MTFRRCRGRGWGGAAGGVPCLLLDLEALERSIVNMGARALGLRGSEAVVELARAIEATERPRFTGVLAYQAAMLHLTSFADRKPAIEAAVA